LITKEKKVEPSITQMLSKEKKVEPSIVQLLTEEKKEIRKNQIEELKKLYRSFFQCHYDPFVDMPCKKLVYKPGDKYCKEHLNPKCIQAILTGKSCNKPTNIPGESDCDEHREEKFVIPNIITKDQIIKPRRTNKPPVKAKTNRCPFTMKLLFG